ncbi:MAG TPA: N-acetyltransferase [Anaerolineae bacterium]|nr:N-acetyltransferase [Anaerolineae bacterium]
MLRGERVILRAIEREDLKNYVKWLNDPVVIKYFAPYRPMSLTQEEQWYEKMLQDESVCNFAIEFEGRHIGGAGLSRIDHRNARAEVGLFIGVPELWDQGLGRDTLRTIVGYGFAQLNLHRIYLRVFAENERAVHAYEQVGFQHEGRMREAEFRHGRYHDILWMSILRPEWEQDSDPG